MMQYRVDANPITGEWPTEPIHDDRVHEAGWHSQKDSDEEHLNTFVRRHAGAKGIGANRTDAIVYRFSVVAGIRTLTRP